MEDKIVKYFDGESSGVPLGEVKGEQITGVILDLETTGLAHDVDEITEVGMVVFKANKLNGVVTEILEECSYLNEPKTAVITEYITNLTGITLEMVKGHKLPVDEIRLTTKHADVIIAHNSRFDRKFVEGKNKIVTPGKLWACSKDDVNWKAHGFICNHLQHLCNDAGFYYQGHRAVIDCMSTLKLLTTISEEGTTYLAELIKTASAPEYVVEAIGAPFSSKDMLKMAGFFWDMDIKVWCKKINTEDLSSLDTLACKVYHAEKQPGVAKKYFTLRKLDKTTRFL